MKQALKLLGLISIASFEALFWSPAPVSAFTFTDLVSFATTTHGYTTVSYGTSQPSGFGWQHSILDELANQALSDVEINDLKILVTYSQTNSTESWRIDGISNLNSVSAMTQSEFILGETFIKDLSFDGILNLTMTEETPGADSFRIFSSKLIGTYQLRPKNKATQIPEPGTIILLLAGWGILRIGRSGRAHHITQG